jgi:hypothetical protein
MNECSGLNGIYTIPPEFKIEESEVLSSMLVVCRSHCRQCAERMHLSTHLLQTAFQNPD